MLLKELMAVLVIHRLKVFTIIIQLVLALQIQLRLPNLQECKKVEVEKEDRGAKDKVKVDKAGKMEVNKEVKVAKIDKVEVKKEVKVAKIDRVEVKKEVKVKKVVVKTDRVAAEMLVMNITVVDHQEERFLKVRQSHKWKQPGKQCHTDLSWVSLKTVFQSTLLSMEEVKLTTVVMSTSAMA